MKRTKLTKGISVLLAVLMIMTSWVFVAPERAEAAEDLSALKTAIDAYEAKVAQGGSTYWTGLTNAFDAYNTAKRYYDAVTYGGYSGSNATTYASALNTAINNMGTETEFIDYCNNITVYANSLKNETVSGATNLIYYGADPSVGFDRAWAANGNAYNWAKLYFRFDIPNFVLGLDGTTTAKAPIQIYYFNSGFDATQYFNSISETTGKFSIPEFAISNTTFSTGIGTTALNQSGNWALNNQASGKYFAGNTGSTGANGTTYVSTSSYMIHQASSYLTTSNSTIGLTASNNSAQISYTLLAARSNNMSASYTSKSSTATTNDIGYAYVVYMTDYNANYKNWQSIIPNLSYKNYSGYLFADGYTAAQKLDLATTVSLAQTGFAEHGDMSSAVDTWADSIQSAATYQLEAKNAATTKIASAYSSLISEILTSDAVKANGQLCYTDASWNAFVTAYDAAKAHMAALSPQGTNNQYSSDNTAINSLYTTLRNARTGLTNKAVTEEGHQWSEVSGAYIAPTCETAGQRGYICNNGLCNQTKTEPIAATGHDYTGTVNNIGDGTHNWLCANGCGTYGTVTDNGDGSFTQNKGAVVDCTFTYTKNDTANHTKSCAVCSYSTSETHTWNTGVVTTEPTCTTTGVKTYTCTLCGETKTEEIAATGHSYVATVTAPTCTEQGYTTHTCSVCGDSYVDTYVDATGHTWDAWSKADDTNHERTCSVCSEKETAAHTWNDGEITTGATCTEAGVKTYTCLVCNGTKTEAIEAKGHTEVSADNAVAATCTTPGKESDTVCSVCGVTVTTGATIDALGHNFTEKVIDDAHRKSAATCTAYAVYYYDCSRCDVMATDSDTNPTFEDTDAGYAAHTYKWVIDKDANCGVDGSKHEECSVCGDKNGVTETIPATGAHNYGAWTQVEIDSVKKHEKTCSVCGDVVSEECTAGDWVIDKVATCQEEGSQYKNCTVCGYEVARESIATISHNFGGAAVSDGNGGHYYTCQNVIDTNGTICGAHGDTVACSGGTATCVDKAVCSACNTAYGEVDASNHKTVVTVAEVDSTCQTVGHTAYDYCEACKTNVTEPVEIALKGHNFGTPVSNGNGTHTATCTTCDPDVATPATKTENCSGGTATCVDKAVCSACNTAYGEVDASNHKTVVTIEEVDSTCQTVGHTAYDYCESCKTNVTEPVEIALKGHNFGTPVSNGNGTHTATCTTCDPDVATPATKTDDCSGGTATCVDKAVCSACHTAYGEVDASNHKTVITVAEVDSTCQTVGHTAYDYCEACKTNVTEPVEIALKGHNFGTPVSNGNGTHTATCTTCDPDVATPATKTENCSGGTATCTKKAECTACGAEYGDLASHTPDTREENRVEASCGTDGSYDLVTYCKVCNEVLSTEHKIIPATGEHNYVTEVEGTKTPATCVAEGSVTMQCGCGATKDVTLAIDPNNHANVVIDNAVAATCITTGLTEGSHCEACGTTIVAQTVTEKAPNNHASEETEIKNAKVATCTEDGYTGDECYKCCGAVKTAGSVITASGHSAAEAVRENEVAATCKTEGSYDSVVYCSACNTELSRESKTIPVDANNHASAETEIKNAKAATCTEDGYTGDECYKCCGAVKTAGSVINASGHSAAEAVKENEVAATCTTDGSYDSVVYCSVCHNELSRETKTIGKLGHSFTNYVSDDNATCTADGTKTAKCDRCDVTDTIADAGSMKAHTPAEAVRENEVAATCTTDGSYDSVVYCSVCHNELSRETKTIGKLGHSFTNYVSDDNATCTADGTKTAKCDRCDATDTIADAGSMKAHTPAEAVRENEVAATCTTDGSYDSVVYCSVCHNELSRETKTISKLGHSFTNYVSDDNATCTADGTKTAKCDRCDATDTIADAGSMKAHTPAEAVKENEVAATCTTDGSYDSVVYCLVCHNELSRETKTIGKLGHSFTNYVSDDNATCTADGTKTAKCDRCDATDTIADAGSAKGHTEEIIPAVAATCTEKGKTEGKKCSVCGEILVAQTETAINPDNHASITPVAEVPATCGSTGIKAHFKCACGKLFADEAGTTEVTAESLVLPIDPSLHVMEETKRIEATCFAEGYIERTCKNCGFSESETIPMLTHRWGEWQVVSAATCQSRAVRQRTCASCKTVESEEFGALAPHSLIVEPGKAAGCEYDGRTDYRYCVVCGYTEPSYVIPATGHNDADGDGKCDECHKNLTGECDCFCHNDNLFSRIVRYIYTLLSKIFRKRITCCDDMEYWNGRIKDLT